MFSNPLDDEYINDANIIKKPNGDYDPDGISPNARKDSNGEPKGHDGVDYKAPIGSSVYAVADGKIIYSNLNDSYGNTIIIQNRDGTATLYAHLKDLSKYKKGEYVNRDIKIGEVGKTGNARLAEHSHLHFEWINKEGSEKIKKGNNKNIGIEAHKYRLNPHNILDKIK